MQEPALVNVGQRRGHADEQFKLIGAEVGIAAQNRFLQVRAVDVFDERVPQAAKAAGAVVVSDVRVIELLQDLAAPLEPTDAAPAETVLGQQHAQDQALAGPVCDQINVRHAAAIDLFEDVKAVECRADHAGATVANHPAVCKRNPRPRRVVQAFLTPGVWMLVSCSVLVQHVVMMFSIRDAWMLGLCQSPY